MTTRKEVRAMQHDHRIQLQLINEYRARQIAEAAEHRLGQARSDQAPGPIRRSVGRTLIRLGQAVASESEPALSPARPR